jgi:hypothetical protein
VVVHHDSLRPLQLRVVDQGLVGVEMNGEECVDAGAEPWTKPIRLFRVQRHEPVRKQYSMNNAVKPA